MLDTIFSQLQLKKEHTLVYSTLLESGPLTAGKLAKRLNMPRSSLYGFLQDLAQKGLVLQSEKQAVKIWQSAPPEKVQEVLNDQINQIEKAKSSFANLLPDLQAKQKTDFIAPKFTYFEGQDGLRQIIKDVLLYRDLKTFAFWPIKDMVEVIGKEFLEQYGTKERILRNIEIQVIVPTNKMIDLKINPFFASNKKLLREVRIAPQNVDYSMGYWIYGNKVAFVSSQKESFGFIVESKELSQLQKTQFDSMWELSRKITTEDKIIDQFIEENKI
jgi:sugar-specific transcriptional regulator TrmB